MAAKRLMGIDIARGLALFGMMAVHVFRQFNDDTSPTVATVLLAGHSAALFAVLAGVSIALMSGARTPVTGRSAKAAAAGIATRAVLIGLVGLILGYATQLGDVYAVLILPFYGLAFLLAVPFLRLGSRSLAALAAGVAIVGPVVVIGLLHFGGADMLNPDLDDVIASPLAFLETLLYSGTYPVLALMAYVFAGMGLGRLDLSSSATAVRMLAGGASLALVAWVISSVLLFWLGTLDILATDLSGNADGTGLPIETFLLWAPIGPVPDWWWLTQQAPHSYAPLALAHSIGVAMAVLGAIILATKHWTGRKLLRPIAIVGTMPLTLYSLHVVVLATPLFEDQHAARYVVQIIGALVLANLWHMRFKQGPLELLLASAARFARQRVTERVPVQSR